MSKKFLTNIDLNGNQLLNPSLQNLASDPGSPTAGQFWLNTTTHLFKWYNGSTVIDPLARANHSGTQLSATISDLSTVTLAHTLDTFAAPVANVAMGGYKLTNLGTPTANTDAATKGYVDAAIAGLEWKLEAAAATTADLGSVTYNNGAGTLTNAGSFTAFAVDGYTASLNDRILVKNQTTQTQNGIYTVTTIGSGSVNWVLTRATDANTGTLLNEATLFVTNGTANTNTVWTQTTTNGVLGTNNVVFVQFAGGASYTNGAGLSLTGNTFSVATGGVSNAMLTNSSLTVTAGTGMSGGGSVSLGGSVTLTNAGVTSAIAGTGISVSGSTGAVTIGNTGVTSIVAGTNISISGGTGAVTVTAAGSGLTRYSTLIGDGSSTAIVVTHSLGTRDITVAVYDASSYAEVECDIAHTSTTTATFTFVTAPASNAYKVVIIG